MKKKNMILAVALSTGLVLGNNSLVHADEINVETIGIDSTKENHTEFDWNAVPKNDEGKNVYPVEIEDWETEDFRNFNIDEETTSIELTEDEEVYNNKDEKYNKNVHFGKNTDGDIKLTQLYDTDLEVTWDGEKPEGKVEGMVYWDANKGFAIDFNDDNTKELPHDDKVNPDTNLPYRNRTPMIYIDGKPAKAGDVLIEDQETKELVFNVDELGNAGYTTIEVDGKIYNISELRKNAIDGTKISFKTLATDVEYHTEGELTGQDEWYDSITDYVDLPWEIRYNNQLPEGKEKIIQPPVRGINVTRTKYTRKDGNVFAQLLETKEIKKAVKGIKEVGTKVNSTPLTPPTPSEDSTTVDYDFKAKEFDVERHPNASIAVGTEVVIQEGSNGYILYKIIKDGNGKEIGRQVVAERLPVNKIVQYGVECDDDKKVSIPLVPLTPAKPIEKEKVSIPWTELTPAKPIEKEVDCTLPLIPLVPTKPIDKTPERPIIDRPIITHKPVVDETTVVIDKEETVVIPVTEETPAPTIDINKIIKEIEEGRKQITDILIENEENQKELNKEDKEKTDDKTIDDNKNKKDEEDKKDTVDEKAQSSKTNTVKVPAKEAKVTRSTKAPKSSNPKTGVAGSASILATLAVAATGLFASKKRK